MIRTGAIDWGNPVARCGLNDGLVSWWLARGPWIGGITWFDLCRRYNGTLTNMDRATDWVASTRPGGVMALDFDGTDDVVAVTGADLYDTYLTDWSSGAWVRFSSLASQRGFVGEYPMEMSVQTDGNFELRVNATGGHILAGTSVLAVDTWYHLFATRAGSTNTLYVNGIADGTATATPSSTNITDFAIGDSFSYSNWLGQIDDVRYYSRGLSAGEVMAIYQDSLAGYPLTLNRLRMPIAYVDPGGGPTTNRRRRLLLGAVA